MFPVPLDAPVHLALARLNLEDPEGDPMKALSVAITRAVNVTAPDTQLALPVQMGREVVFMGDAQLQQVMPQWQRTVAGLEQERLNLIAQIAEEKAAKIRLETLHAASIRATNDLIQTEQGLLDKEQAEHQELIRKREVLERGLPGLESCYGTRGGRKVLVCSPEAAINIIRRELGEI